MFPDGSLENPLRYLFGPRPDQPTCMAIMPQCMGLIPYWISRFATGS